MIIECPNGWEFDTKANTFEKEVWDGFVYLTAQDLADMLSVYHAEKVKKDLQYRKEHE